MYATYMEQHDIVPEVSVLMGVYYHRENLELLQRSIRSILEQTFSNFEFLICDNGSSEAAREYIRESAAEDSRIRLVERCDLVTLPAKLNACLREAKGQFIARMDDDDSSHPDRFEKQLSSLREDPKLDFLGSNAELWRSGVRVGMSTLPKRPEVRDFLFVQPYIHPTLMFRRLALLSVGGYCEDKHCILCEDYDLLLRLYENGCRGANLQECLLDYTLANTAKGNRKLKHRWNETITRYRHFRNLHLLPGALPYVAKPILTGLLPNRILTQAKKMWYRGNKMVRKRADGQ